MRLDALRHLALAFLVAPAIALGAACAAGEAAPLGEGGGTNVDPESTETACILHNCNADAECGDCSDGRTTCKMDEHRCVACDAHTNSGCPEGEVCSSYGNCVPDGLTCPTDDHGEPQITCATSADCAACDPMHQVCDPATKRCVACTINDTSECGASDICIASQCEAKCPAACSSDNDCGQCGAPGHEAHACNAHQCSQCSATYACQAGETCSPEGVCVAFCGSDGQGTCESDADCGQCGGGNARCHKPLNSAGTCGPEANGCSDLGDGALALPDPWNDITNTCSNDADCAGVGIQYNVGELLRDMTGFDQIGDANIDYGMNVCAAITVGNGADTVSCGVCVPCKEDSDCKPISVDDVAAQAFGPLGKVAAAVLLDQIFGQNDHQIHMFCQTVGAGYGVCAPCPGLLYDCGVDNGGGDGGNGGGTCDHDVCSAGSALDGSCDACANDVCAVDDYCCTNSWDAQCVSEVAQYCGQSCGGGGGGCVHDECSAGDALDAACSSCASSVCGADSYCCDNSWDATCVSEADQYCNSMCGGGGSSSSSGGGGSCAHDECTAGDALDASCSDCASALCAGDAYCCNNQWDQQCVNEVQTYCGYTCGYDQQNGSSSSSSGSGGGGQSCSSAFDCPWPEGCRADGTCGPCESDYDCGQGYSCDTGTGDCY